MTGAGMKPTLPVASERKPGVEARDGRPSVNSSAAPRAMLIMPSVTMNGGRPPQLTSAPLQQAAADADRERPATSATGSGWPPCSAAPSTTPDSATIEPTDRSMPPERITNVMPTATMALMLVCCGDVQQVRDGEEMRRERPEHRAQDQQAEQRAELARRSTRSSRSAGQP